MVNELRSFWSRYFKFNWKLGIILIFLICIPRFFLVLQANANNNYSFIGLIMVVSAIIPFVFLNKNGQKQSGFTKTNRYSQLFLAFVSGLFFSFILYWIGQLLYGNSFENWYNYIGKSYNIPAEINLADKRILFIIMAATGMTFSPIGEELFFRGIVHTAFAKSVGDKKASVIDSLAFAFTHISHFGLVFIANEWKFLFIPALIWVTFMFLVSLLFSFFKKYTNSILGAILCHSGFNLGMIYCIFYLI